MKHARLWTFRVQVETQPGEVVGVTGNIPELGEWKVSENSKIVLLTKDTSNPNCDDIWTVTTLIPSNTDIYYRFYICIVVDNEKVIVRRREVSLRPRVISKKVVNSIMELGKTESFDRFGYYDECYRVDNGWLTTQTIIQFKLHSNPIFFWKEKLKNRQPLVKLTPVNLAKKNNPDNILTYESMDNNSLSLDTLDIGGGGSDIWPVTEICVINDSEGELQSQSQFGRIINPDDFIVFQIQAHHIENYAYLVDFYMYRSRAGENEPPCHIGFSYIMPGTLTSSEGRVVVPVTSTKHHPIGQLSVDYIIIKPIADYICDMSVSYAKYWKHSVQGLDVGHRGLGTSFKQKSCAAGVRENTIASLKEAASHGADYVEFDVQLSKDMVPVIYHDFHVCISLKGKKVSMEDMLEIPLKELTLEQLQCLKVYHVQEGKIKKQLFFDEHLEDHQPFPTLQHALATLDPIVGFNIEIKWTMLLKDGTFELNNPFDLNAYLDSMLKVVLDHGGNRKIIFSCFHPDICTMRRLCYFELLLEITWQNYKFEMLVKQKVFILSRIFAGRLPIWAMWACVGLLKDFLNETDGLSDRIRIAAIKYDPAVIFHYQKVRYKQTKYPVMFLTQGVTSKYPMYHDPRCHTIPAAVYFAKSLGILGINVHTEDILRDPKQLAFAKDRDLIVFCWGDDNNDPETIKYLKKLGLHAVIYDKINEFGPKKLQDNLYVSEAKEHQQQLLEVIDHIHSPPSNGDASSSSWLTTEATNDIVAN